MILIDVSVFLYIVFICICIGTSSMQDYSLWGNTVGRWKIATSQVYICELFRRPTEYDWKEFKSQ